jgi:hypothetical protein
MKIITVAEYSRLKHNHKNIYCAFINAKYYDCTKAIIEFSKYPSTFREGIVTSREFAKYHPYNVDKYVKEVALLRFNAIKEMEKLMPGERYLLEFFEEYTLQGAGIRAREIIHEYQYQKKLRYALLH